MNWFFKKKKNNVNQEDISHHSKKNLDTNDEGKKNSDSSSNTDSDDEPRFIKKENFEEITDEVKEEVEEIVEELSHNPDIRPEGYKRRNLDVETGGVEQEKDKGISDKDAWDDRSEEVDKMGSFNPLGSSGKKSMIWRLKKKRLDAKKHNKGAQESMINSKTEKPTKKSLFNSAEEKQGYAQKLTNFKKLRHDHGFNNDHGGGYGR